MTFMASLKGGVAVGRSPATESMGNVRRELETSWLGVLQCPQCICPLLSFRIPGPASQHRNGAGDKAVDGM